MNIIKRNGEEQTFATSKIVCAINKANQSVPESERIDEVAIAKIAEFAESHAADLGRAVSVEEVQDWVEMSLMEMGAFALAKNYITYRYQHELARRKNTTDAEILSLVECENEEVLQENANKNPTVASVQRDYMAGMVSKDMCRRYLYPKDVMEAHDNGLIHIHDLDYVFSHIHNCELVNLEDMLQNGTVINGNLIEKPKSFLTACTIATQISAQVASCTFGGQTISLAHISPFIDVSRQKIRRQVMEELSNENITEKKINDIIEKRLRSEVKSGVQTCQYQISTIMSTNGQTPFISVMMCLGEAEEGTARDDLAMLIEEVLNQRIIGVKNEKGVYVTPAFPKLLYVLDDYNANEGSKYWYLTELAAKCTAKRMVPDYISAKIMRELKVDRNGNGQVYPCMGCRAFLTPYVDENGKPKYYGRFNMGACTLNLVDVALTAIKESKESKRDIMEKFWSTLEDRAELVHRAQQIRAQRLHGVKSDVAPILWQYGALARLKKGETIDHMLHGGYSTISLGYAGLWECVLALTGKKLTDEDGEKIGLEIMQRLNGFTAKWKAAENMDWSVYGTPLETTTYRLAKCLQKRFGSIPNITDKNYITNSYHVNVREPIDGFTKLTHEAKFQRLSPGGAISYVEVPNLQNNITAVLALVKHIYNTIMYAELNTRSDYCHECGFDGEIKIIEDDNGKLVWECPNCGNRNQNKMNVARRTCGYIGSNFWNQGRTQEIKERVLHVE